MSLLRRTRTEVAGAWRSLRYDLGRGAPAEPPADGPDVTSTGMGTFGLQGLGGNTEPAPPVQPPRRAVAVTVFGTLTVAGAAGAYLAVVNGLGSLVPGSEAEAGTLPPRPAVTTAVGLGPSSPAAAKRVARPVVPRETVAPAPPGPPPPPSAVPPTTGPAVAPPAKGPIRTTKPVTPECHCDPPAPTPTTPSRSPSPTPSPSPPESPSPSPSASESGDADHSADPSPSRSWHGNGHRRRH